MKGGPLEEEREKHFIESSDLSITHINGEYVKRTVLYESFTWYIISKWRKLQGKHNPVNAIAQGGGFHIV